MRLFRNFMIGPRRGNARPEVRPVTRVPRSSLPLLGTEETEAARQMRRDGVSYTDIASRFCVSRGQVYASLIAPARALYDVVDMTEEQCLGHERDHIAASAALKKLTDYLATLPSQERNGRRCFYIDLRQTPSADSQQVAG